MKNRGPLEYLKSLSGNVILTSDGIRHQKPYSQCEVEIGEMDGSETGQKIRPGKVLRL
jgi:hypothetical protein